VFNRLIDLSQAKRSQRAALLRLSTNSRSAHSDFERGGHLLNLSDYWLRGVALFVRPQHSAGRYFFNRLTAQSSDFFGTA
jgi:hypothetical protein